MDKVITTALLIIAGVVVTVMLYNVVYPAVIRSGDALTSRQRRIDERLDSQIEIIHATSPSDDPLHAYAWVKNIGSSRIAAIERCDVFFGPEGAFSRIPYDDEGSRYWTCEVVNDIDWEPMATLQITITITTDDSFYPLSEGVYYVKVGLPNGVSDEDYFSIPTPTP